MVVKCDKGHWYDDTVNKVCPHCKRAGEQLDFRIDDDLKEDDRTISLAEANASLSDELSSIIDSNVENINLSFADGGDDDRTISFGLFGFVNDTSPVTGWLVCMNGSEKGKDFRLHSGKNFIGRNADMDVALIDDKTVSREKHCSVVYDPKGNHFFVSPEHGNLTYLNDEMIDEAKSIDEGDIITIGDTKLVFIPFCKEERLWKED